ncbi:hypothetical protein Tco_0155153 [Tanacetum coccineum]
MQDEIHECDRLEVWELVPRPVYVMVIALKWIYKVKLDEYGDVLKNKARCLNSGGMSKNTRRSTSGSAQFLGEKLVSWSSKKQRSTAIRNRGLKTCMSGCLCSNPKWMRS